MTRNPHPEIRINHIFNNTMRSQRRIQKELEKFNEESDGLRVEVLCATQWRIHFEGPPPLYSGEHLALRLTFGNDYPMDSPEVVFELSNVPEHPHIYSNGHICLNILGTDWTPALTARSICISIISMLASATEKARPADNDRYVRNYVGKSPKETSFIYHDDTV
jgi:ubiquitin-conjugating enzyme E2 W